MKKALVGYQGWVSEIRNPGEEYEIYEGPGASMMWVNAPDEITLDWTLEWSPGQQTMIWVERDGPFSDNSVARKVAYGDIGAQLDMIYHELETSGTISREGQWFQHVSAVKSMIDPPPPPRPPETLEAMMARQATEEPSPEKPNIPSSLELPSWERYKGWKGYRTA